MFKISKNQGVTRMIKARKVRLYPTKEQEEQLWKSVNAARYIYNWTLAKQIENYKQGNSFLSDSTLRKEITQLKKGELDWLNKVSNNVPKQAVKDACNAYKNFFNNRAKYPRFKSKKRSKKSFFNDNVKLKVKPNEVLLEKIGWVKIKEQIPMGVAYSNPRISYDNKYWYISVGIKEEVKDVKLTNVSLGIDLGLKDLAICSNKTVFKNINKTKRVKKLEKKLKRFQRQLSRKYEMNKQGKEYVKTNNILKLENRIRLLHRQLANIRNNYLHQVTTRIVKTKPYRIVIEDLNVKGMMKNKCLAEAVSKQGFNEFRRQLTYKCESYGIELVIADRFFPSSKTCSKCGKIKKDLKLSDRTYKCECGFTMNRDLNASINLANYKLV
jgi:putative transposase